MVCLYRGNACQQLQVCLVLDRWDGAMEGCDSHVLK